MLALAFRKIQITDNLATLKSDRALMDVTDPQTSRSEDLGLNNNFKDFQTPLSIEIVALERSSLSGIHYSRFLGSLDGCCGITARRLHRCERSLVLRSSSKNVPSRRVQPCLLPPRIAFRVEVSKKANPHAPQYYVFIPEVPPSEGVPTLIQIRSRK